MGYYKSINGKRMDAYLLKMAEEAIRGEGDGRISIKDAKAIVEAVKDGGDYTDVEKNTMEYIRDNFKWTESADEWFRKEIAIWAAKKED